MNDKIKTLYSSRLWLNDKDSPSTGNITAFDGYVSYEDEKPYRVTQVKISDCYHVVKLHRADYDTMEDFIQKLTLMRNEIDCFIEHLKSN